MKGSVLAFPKVIILGSEMLCCYLSCEWNYGILCVQLGFALHHHSKRADTLPTQSWGVNDTKFLLIGLIYTGHCLCLSREGWLSVIFRMGLDGQLVLPITLSMSTASPPLGACPRFRWVGVGGPAIAGGDTASPVLGHLLQPQARTSPGLHGALG